MDFQILWSQLNWRSMADVLLVAVLFYQIIAMLKGTRAAQILIGMLVIFVAYALSSLLELETLNWIISKFYSSFIIVVIVLFQDDIRRLLTRFGRSPFVSGIDENSGLRVIEEVINAVKYLSHDRLGAILVFERGIGLDRLYDHSIRLDALVSEQLLICIFQSFSPLHDGAVIIQKNRITCASAQLPLSKNPTFSKKLGTRHSAAVGISEETDAVVLVVSEETGAISLAFDGRLQKQSSPEAARRALISQLLPSHDRRTNGNLLERVVFSRLNLLRLRWRAIFASQQRPYDGPERRVSQRDRRSGETQTDRRHGESGAHTTLRSVEMENRLASSETRLSLRFPNYSKIKSARTDGSRFVLSGTLVEKGLGNGRGDEHSSSDHAPSDDPFGTGAGGEGDHSTREAKETLFEGEMSYSHLEDEIPENPASESVYAQNEAAKALTMLGPEDKFVPPDCPPPTPRDEVSIGGIPLNPPLDPLANDQDAKKRATPDKPDTGGES